MHFIGQQQLQFFETVVAVIFLYVCFMQMNLWKILNMIGYLKIFANFAEESYNLFVKQLNE